MTSQVQLLTGQVEELQRALVAAQQVMIRQHDLLMEQQAKIDGLANTAANPRAGGQTLRGRSPEPRLSPFEAQAVAIGDRRFLGLFDARYHSASGCATLLDMHNKMQTIL